MKLWLAFFFGIAVLGFYPAQAAERVALVIGNGAYQNGSVLVNPVNDAQLLANALQAAQFEVTLAKDAGHADMEKAIINFRRSAEGAKAAWFFYAGHGLEVKGSNYLVPVDAQVDDESQVKFKTVALDLVLSVLDEAGTPLKVVVLDCCRNNPFGRSWSRSGSAGLSQVTNTPSGTIIAFAAAPGNVALDGTGANSPYTTALSQALALPGKEIDQVFKETGRLVLAATDKKQQPWINSSFYDTFIPCPGDPGSAPPPYTPPVVTTPTMPTPPATVAYTPPATVPTPPTMNPAYPAAPARVLKPLALPLDRGQKLQADTVTLTPITWKAGRWPERMALVGSELWLAESGQRTLACFDINSGLLKDRVTCGRLPVYLTVANNEVYGAICTDNIIWKQRPMGGGGGQYADTGGDYTVAITSSPDAVFALLNIGGSSENAVVMRMDLRSGQITRSGKLGSNATDLAFAGGNLWLLANPYVDNAANAVLTRMDPYSMATYESYPHYEYGRMLATSGNLLFLGSGGEEGGSVASFDATTGQAVGYSDPTGKPVSCVAAWDRFVVASDTGGTTHVLLANNMRTQRIINLSHGAFEPRHLVAAGDALYLSAFQGEEGAIYKVPAWQPDGEVAEDVYTRLLKTESLNGVKINMAESEVVRLIGQPESMTPETLNEAFGLYFTDYTYQGGRLVVTLSTETQGGPKTVVMARAEAGANVSTFGGIMMGDGLNELRTVYAEYEDRQESPVPNPPTNESYNYVVGSIYGGVIFQVTNGKVDHMILGAGAE
jgi:Caspase domain